MDEIVLRWKARRYAAGLRIDGSLSGVVQDRHTNGREPHRTRPIAPNLIVVRLSGADGLIVVGALVAVGGAIRATLAYARYFRARKIAPTERMNRAIAAMEFGYSTSLAAVITGAGIAVLVAGLVIGSGVQAWTILMPVGLAAGGAFNAWFSRRTIDKLRKSSTD